MKHILTALLLIAAFAVAACGGKSDQEKAQDQVCDARADIQKQVNELTSLTLSTATVDGVQGNLQAIQKDLGQIRDAQGDLTDERKQQVQSATQSFSSAVQSVAKSLGSSLSLGGAKSQLESALRQLGQSYNQALQPIDCG